MIMLSMFLLISATAQNQSVGSEPTPRYKFANPSDPFDYLPRIDLAFAEFRARYRYYPTTWFSITTNCRVLRDPVCELEKERPLSERMGSVPFKSRYAYVIVRSAQRTYRVEAQDLHGVARYYIDQRHKVVRIR